ncbi:MAG: TIGR03032 family protein [Gammaproteobacteria bacterium]
MSKRPEFEFLTSRQFTAWMHEQSVSLVFTTYQAGKLFFLGMQPNGRLEIFNRTFNRSMGLHATPDTLYMSTLYQLWRFENGLQAGEEHRGYDRVYVPQVAWTTGDLDIHDIGVDHDGRPVFVNTLFGCLATVSESHSFEPLWRPPFLSRLAAEDRCHLNGVAIADGLPRYVTSVSRSDVADGWRDARLDGGVVTDVVRNEVVLEGLSMPHSPRWYRDRLWLLDSGNGYFGHADLDVGRFEKVAFCAGYARGLAFHGDYAIVGVSRPRENKTFSGLRLDIELTAKHAEARCGLLIVDLRSGDIVHWLRITGLIGEIYDVAVLPGVRRPMAVGLKTDEIRRVLSVAPAPKEARI